MRPCKFPEFTDVLQPPKGQNEDQCLPLYVHRDGEHCISCWDPSDEERKLIAEGGKVWLLVRGGWSSPPVAVTAVKPL
jgi:hypothetical protein